MNWRKVDPWLCAPVVYFALMFGVLAHVAYKADARNAENARIAAECKR